MKRLYRDRWDKKMAGVFGGLGVYFNLDPTLLRIIGVILIPLTAFFLVPLIYLIAAIIIPEGPRNYIKPECRKLYRTARDRRIAGVCAAFAHYFRVDPTIFRLVAIVLTVCTGGFPVIIIYFVSSFIIPMKSA